MPDIFFQCAACGNHLVVDEARRGLSANCPDCRAAIIVPTLLSVRQCPKCGERLMLAPNLKGALVHCSSCREPIRAPGSAGGPAQDEASVVMVCPQCHVNVQISEEISNRPTPCPHCGEQVYFQNEPGSTQNHSVGPSRPKDHDALRFRRKIH